MGRGPERGPRKGAAAASPGGACLPSAWSSSFFESLPVWLCVWRDLYVSLRLQHSGGGGGGAAAPAARALPPRCVPPLECEGTAGRGVLKTNDVVCCPGTSPRCAARVHACKRGQCGWQGAGGDCLYSLILTHMTPTATLYHLTRVPALGGGAASEARGVLPWCASARTLKSLQGHFGRSLSQPLRVERLSRKPNRRGWHTVLRQHRAQSRVRQARGVGGGGGGEAGGPRWPRSPACQL